jgi:hypothetical protein
MHKTFKNAIRPYRLYRFGCFKEHKLTVKLVGLQPSSGNLTGGFQCLDGYFPAAVTTGGTFERRRSEPAGDPQQCKGMARYGCHVTVTYSK